MKMEFLLVATWHSLIMLGVGALLDGETTGYVTFHMSNKCPFSVWPAAAPNAGHAVVADGGGFFLPSGHVRRVEVPPDWNGRFWGRTRCNFTAGGREGAPPACQTGDCRSLLACNGTVGLPPATLVEVSLQSDASKPSFYDVSVVDGYNLPIAVSTKPSNTNCFIDGCRKNLNSICPDELKVVVAGDDHSSEVVACKSPCVAFDLDVFCCRNSFADDATCKASVYSKAFKDACPSYVTFAFDTESLVSCAAKDYVITFCPSKWGGGHLRGSRDRLARC